MIEYIILLVAIPLGMLCAKWMKEERPIYSKAPYFPVMLWVIAILSAIFFTLDKTIGFSLSFMFLLMFFWHRG
ncbi:hypothetical protein HN604_02170 [archaeon]|jgi:hypothetical protein|nr:hypothetical protein [archaeon]MBT6182589.1 hypothetical protein [archaeon]MBT6606267.1 hypothetical protein [archaeon]MBT7251564.1 hypothetical protein [archaeon]MBT7660867.1 hypothetical protein [archaeon]